MVSVFFADTVNVCMIGAAVVVSYNIDKCTGKNKIKQKWEITSVLTKV